MLKRSWFAAALMMGLSAIVSPHVSLAKDTKPAAASSVLVDLNTATAAQLEALPGIGPAKAKAIIEGRPYASLEDFHAKGIVSGSAYDKMKDQLTVTAAAATKPAKAATAPAAAPAGPVDLNTATAAQLEALPGIGPAKAKAIIEGRPYASLEDFHAKGIVSGSAYDKMKDQLTVTAAAAPKPAKAATAPAATPAGPVDLNTATASELEALPGIGPAKAKAIIEGRPYASLEDFQSKGIVSGSVYGKLKDQLTVTAAAAPKPAKPAKAATAPAATPAGPVDLNTATASELEALPGIGPAKAKAIIEGRPYKSVDDFASRGIVSASVVTKIKDEVTVSGTAAKAKTQTADTADEANPPEPVGKIDLNTATADELEVLPGIGPVKAKAIVEGRPYASIAAFEAKGIVAKSTLDKFRDAIEVVPVTKAAANPTTTQGTPGREAAQKRIKMCGAQWRAAKAANEIPTGQTWPQYWSQCNTMLKKKGY